VRVGRTGNFSTYLGPTISLNEWTHIALSASNSASKLYVNGIQVASGGGYDANNMGNNFIGFGSFIGVIDEIRFWNSARTADQIRSSMNASLAGNETGLAAYWRLDEASGLTTIDQSGNLADGYVDDGVDNTTVDAMRIASTAPIPGASCFPRELSFNFGLLSPGQIAQDSLWVVNLGTVQLVVDSVRTTVGSSYSISPNSATIAPQDSTLFVVTFTPLTEGQYADSVRIYHTAAGSPLAIPLAGVRLPAPSAPDAVTNAATSITLSGATFNGSVGANGDTTTVRFVYGTSSGTYTDSVTASQSPLATWDSLAVSANLSGLTPGQTYYVRVAATNDYGYVRGNEESFTTSDYPMISQVPGSLLSFNGTTQYVAVPDHPSLRLTDNFTFEAWVYPTRSSDVAIIDKGSYNYLFMIRPSPTTGLGFYNGNTGWIYSAGTVPVNQWSHVALVFQTGTNGVKFYLNGSLLSEHTPQARF